jgi:hypothetical protein
LVFFLGLSLSLSLSLSRVCVLLPMWCCKIKLVWCFFLVAEFVLLLFLFFSSTNFCDSFLWWAWEESWTCFRCCCCCRCVCVCVGRGCVFLFGCASVSSFCYICMQKFMLCVFPSMLARKWWRRWWFCDDEDDGSVTKMMMVLLCTREGASRGIGILCDGGYGHGFQE